MAVSKRTRYEVLRRDNHTCRYCGGTAPDAKLTIDHVTPVTLGGTDHPDNLVAACTDCNAGKSSVPPGAPLVDDVKEADAKWAGAIKRAGEIRAAEREQEDIYVRVFDDVWDHWRPDNYRDSLTQMRSAGLSRDEMADAAMIARTNRGIDDRWRYFCGVSWRKVAKLQEIAKALLEADAAGQV